jgi:hypothetical protein
MTRVKKVRSIYCWRIFSIGILGSCGPHYSSSPVFDQEPLRLEVVMEAPAKVELALEESVTVNLWLRNGGARPLTISHGPRLLILQATRLSPTLERGSSGRQFSIPQVQSWGEVRRVEYPNPGAAYTTPLIQHTIPAGGQYGPTTYRVAFDSLGTYVLQPCAQLISDGIDYSSEIRICSSHGMTIVVRQRKD